MPRLATASDAHYYLMLSFRAIIYAAADAAAAAMLLAPFADVCFRDVILMLCYAACRLIYAAAPCLFRALCMLPLMPCADATR